MFMKTIFTFLICTFITLAIYSCSDKDNDDTSTPFFDKDLLATWESVIPDDSTYISYNSYVYTSAGLYLKQISWKENNDASVNVTDRWVFNWTSYRTIKRYPSESEISNLGEVVTYKISNNGDSLFINNRVYKKNDNLLVPL